MTVSLTAVTKKFGATPVIDALSATFEAEAISVLLGPSGCGKTTTLRCIAGLETPDDGTIAIGGTVVFRGSPRVDVPPERRNLSMVFQSYAIWPHMTVAENVALPLKARGVERSEAKRRLQEAIALVGLAGFEQRMATQLSGGQQQRVALARSIAWPSKVILLDEPLSNLDAGLRVAMRRELRDLQRQLNSTLVFVTHDQEEAMSLADRIFLFRNGRIVQHGKPVDIYRFPETRYAAEFLGRANFIEVHTVTAAGGNVELRARNGATIATLAPTEPYTDAVRTCVVRPESWHVRGADGPGLRARVLSRAFLGGREEISVETELGEVSLVDSGRTGLAVGDHLTLLADAASVHFLPSA